jgi:hypothetical protein
VRWCVIRNPDLGAAVVAEDTLVVHEARGWVVTSPLVDDRYSLNPDDYPLPEPESVAAEDTASGGPDNSDSPAPTSAARTAAAKTRAQNEE